MLHPSDDIYVMFIITLITHPTPEIAYAKVEPVDLQTQSAIMQMRFSRI
jgi:hypothetical protein